MSTLAIWCRLVQSRDVVSRVFSRPAMCSCCHDTFHSGILVLRTMHLYGAVRFLCDDCKSAYNKCAQEIYECVEDQREAQRRSSERLTVRALGWSTGGPITKHGPNCK